MALVRNAQRRNRDSIETGSSALLAPAVGFAASAGDGAIADAVARRFKRAAHRLLPIPVGAAREQQQDDRQDKSHDAPLRRRARTAPCPSRRDAASASRDGERRSGAAPRGISSLVKTHGGNAGPGEQIRVPLVVGLRPSQRRRPVACGRGRHRGPRARRDLVGAAARAIDPPAAMSGGSLERRGLSADRAWLHSHVVARFAATGGDTSIIEACARSLSSVHRHRPMHRSAYVRATIKTRRKGSRVRPSGCLG
jgi:hypothetical protein